MSPGTRGRNQRGGGGSGGYGTRQRGRNSGGGGYGYGVQQRGWDGGGYGTHQRGWGAAGGGYGTRQRSWDNGRTGYGGRTAAAPRRSNAKYHYRSMSVGSGVSHHYHPRTGGKLTGNGSAGRFIRRAEPGSDGNMGLRPIKVASSGIMSSWKKPLGPLIVSYIHKRITDQHPIDQQAAEHEIDSMYYQSNCGLEDTKRLILEKLGVPEEKQQSMVDISMAIEKDGLDDIPTSDRGNEGDSMDVSNDNGGATSGFEDTIDGKGIKLKQVLRAGEGPAHADKLWTTVVVPEWAGSKSFFFEVENNSSLNLSCELFLDGEKVARNAPLPPHDTRTIRPDNVRYYARHKWMLNGAKKVKLGTACDSAEGGVSVGKEDPGSPTGQRCERAEDRELTLSPADKSQVTKETQSETIGDHSVKGRPTYYARDDNYDFKLQGHRNRRDEMSRLQPSADYKQWKKANTKEYAVVHAKFYVSVPKRRHQWARQRSASRAPVPRRGKQTKLLPLPEQVTVIDVKAAEHATLGTKYEATGPPRNIGRASVRMERINGLRDEKGWSGDPVFEKKLYYRDENVINGKGHESSDDVDNMSDGSNPEMGEKGSLNEYKADKIDQITQHRSELIKSVSDPEQAEQRLRNAMSKVNRSESHADVDDAVNLFYHDFTLLQIGAL